MYTIFGILNDNNSLYLRLSTRDRNLQRQLLVLDFTVWFDIKGGKKKNMGLHFPIGIQGSGMQMMGRGRRTSQDDEVVQLQKMLEDSQQDIEIIGPGKKERITLLVSDVMEYGAD